VIGTPSVDRAIQVCLMLPKALAAGSEPETPPDGGGARASRFQRAYTRRALVTTGATRLRHSVDRTQHHATMSGRASSSSSYER
jgi:hypothetical protein